MNYYIYRIIIFLSDVRRRDQYNHDDRANRTTNQTSLHDRPVQWIAGPPSMDQQ